MPKCLVWIRPEHVAKFAAYLHVCAKSKWTEKVLPSIRVTAICSQQWASNVVLQIEPIISVTSQVEFMSIRSTGRWGLSAPIVSNAEVRVIHCNACMKELTWVQSYKHSTQCAKDCGPFRTIWEGIPACRFLTGMLFFNRLKPFLNGHVLIFYFCLNLHNLWRAKVKFLHASRGIFKSQVSGYL